MILSERTEELRSCRPVYIPVVPYPQLPRDRTSCATKWFMQTDSKFILSSLGLARELETRDEDWSHAGAELVIPIEKSWEIASWIPSHTFD